MTQQKQNLGFTLIELIVVVSIIGILAVIAMPKYLSMTQASRIAALRGLAGNVSAASTAASAQCVVTQGCFANNMTWLLTIGGSNFQMWNGYPDAGDALGTIEIDMLVNASSHFTPVLISQQITSWQLASAPDPTNCAVQYQEASSTTVPPVVSVLTTGC